MFFNLQLEHVQQKLKFLFVFDVSTETSSEGKKKWQSMSTFPSKLVTRTGLCVFINLSVMKHTCQSNTKLVTCVISVDFAAAKSVYKSRLNTQTNKVNCNKIKLKYC